MEKEILIYLRIDRKYETGVSLVLKHSRRHALKRQLISHPESDYTRGIVYEELRELAQLSQQELKYLLLEPVLNPPTDLVTTKQLVYKSVESQPDNSNQFDYPLESANSETRQYVDINSLPVFRINNEFPFLNRADCPTELKILVADMLTAHENYVQSHAALFTCHTQAEIKQASKETVENYLENRRIWKELNHYKKACVILGEHPIFEKIKKAEHLRGLQPGELITLKSRHEHNIYVIKRNIQKQPNHKMTGSRLNTIHKLEQELAEINRLLGI